MDDDVLLVAVPEPTPCMPADLIAGVDADDVGYDEESEPIPVPLPPSGEPTLLSVDCCFRLRYSLIESFLFGAGGGSGAVKLGLSRGS